MLKGAEEEAKQNPKTAEEERAEEERLLALGERQAKKLGIRACSVRSFSGWKRLSKHGRKAPTKQMMKRKRFSIII